MSVVSSEFVSFRRSRLVWSSVFACGLVVFESIDSPADPGHESAVAPTPKSRHHRQFEIGSGTDQGIREVPGDVSNEVCCAGSEDAHPAPLADLGHNQVRCVETGQVQV